MKIIRKFLHCNYFDNKEIFKIDITDFFNKIASDLFTNHIKKIVSFDPYKLISLSPEYYKKELNKPVKRIYTNMGSKLYIRDIYFSDRTKLNILLNYELLYLILKEKFYEIEASDVAFALIWDLERNRKIKKWIYSIWVEMHPPYNMTVSQIFFLAGYVSAISNKKNDHYYNLFMTEYFRRSGKLNKLFPYQVAIPHLSDFSKTDLTILNSVINNNSRKLELISKITNFSYATLSNSINKLTHTFILRQRVRYSFRGLGWKSIIGIFTSKRNTNDFIRSFDYPWRRIITVFRGTEDLTYCNFYIPDTYYAREYYFKWIKDSILFDNRKIQIHTQSPPLFGFEREAYKLVIQQPNLFDKDSNSWKIGIENPEFEQSNSLSYKSITWNKKKREVALEMIRKPYTKNELHKKLGGNRSNLFKIINELEESKIVEKEFILPFFDDLIRVLILYDGRKYEEIIQKISYTLPYSINSIFENTLGANNHIGSKLVGYSFYSVPGYYLERLHEKLLSIDPNCKIALFPQNITTTPTYNPQPTDEGWKFIKIPSISFISNSRGLY